MAAEKITAFCCQVWFEKEAVTVKIEQKITTNWLFMVRAFNLEQI